MFLSIRQKLLSLWPMASELNGLAQLSKHFRRRSGGRRTNAPDPRFLSQTHTAPLRHST